MRTAAMTETRVAWDGDRQHVKQWPWIVDSLNCSELYRRGFLKINFLPHIQLRNLFNKQHYCQRMLHIMSL